MQQSSETKSMATKLVFVTIAMFGFGFGLVPLYDVICEVTGLNGKTGGKYEPVAAMTVDRERTITVQFLTNNNAGMPWEFRPESRTMEVHPGEPVVTTFYARNPRKGVMVAQAVPSVSPMKGAAYFHKTECFCFEQQQLEGGQDVDMPLRFIVDTQLPEDVTTLTLSYTLFDITEMANSVAVNQGS